MPSNGKRKLGEMSVEDFVNEGFNDLDEDNNQKKNKKHKKNKLELSVGKQNGRKTKKAVEEVDTEDYEDNAHEASEHKTALKKLKQSDPEFYKYLEQNDGKLLDFSGSDASDDDDNEAETRVKRKKQKTKKNKDRKTNKEDEESVGDDDDVKRKGGSIVVSMKMINDWTIQLQSENVKPRLLSEMVNVFYAAVEQVQGSTDQRLQSSYIVEDGAIFNDIIRMCVVHLLPAMNRILKVSQEPMDREKPISSHKMWTKMHTVVKNYLRGLFKILVVVAEPAIVSVLLKHVVQLIPYITADIKFANAYLKKLIYFWYSGEETCRVLAFIAIIKITKLVPPQLYEFVLKSMYMAYVKNTKFTSPTTWPMINFMRRSLVEVFAMDLNQAYQYSFVYIRQLAIHLRNAITMKQKGSWMTVYNWQFIHCLHFLAQLLAALHSKITLRPLIYPLVQIIMGTIKLIPGAQYFPLRFQCVRILILISRETQTFIPVLPILTEVLEMIDVSKRPRRAGFKTLDFACMLKISKGQLVDHGFKDGLLDQVYELIMEYLTSESHCIGFPELVVPTILQLKAFLKKCKVQNYTKIIKQLLEKIIENSKMICENRKNVTFSLNDRDMINAWEMQIKSKGTPMVQFYEKYSKLRERELTLAISKKEEIVREKFSMPEIDHNKLKELHLKKSDVDLGDIFGVNDYDKDLEEDLFTKKVREIESIEDEEYESS